MSAPESLLSERGRAAHTCSSLEKMSAAHVSASIRWRGHEGEWERHAHVLQPPDYFNQRMSRVGPGWLGHTVTSVMYGMGIEALGAKSRPPDPGNWEKLRLRVVAMPLRRRHAVLCVFMILGG